jgi:AraC family transcriptional regulator, regulatory protein of adaptative response / DNA-3-methyladenine glycosylase II
MAGSASAGRPALEERLPYRPPLDSAALLAFLGARTVAGVERLDGDVYRRTLQTARGAGVIELRPDEGALALRTHPLCGLFEPEDGRRAARRLFDLDCDPAVVAGALGTDPLLAPLVAQRPGLRVAGAVDGFEMAVRAVVGQQVSVAGARTLLGRLTAAVGSAVPSPHGETWRLFPTARQVAEGSLDGLGLTGARIRSLKAVAGALLDGRLRLDPPVDAGEALRVLATLPGFGPWTRSYLAMRALADRDALPAADLGLRRAFEAHGLAGDAKSIELRAEAWRPWRAYAVHHLWASEPGPRPRRERRRPEAAAP